MEIPLDVIIQIKSYISCAGFSPEHYRAREASGTMQSGLSKRLTHKALGTSWEFEYGRFPSGMFGYFSGNVENFQEHCEALVILKTSTFGTD